MIRAWTIGLALLLSSSFLAGQEPAPAEPIPEVLGNNELACRLLRELAEQEGNLFVAPLSIRTALAMTYGGAGGSTAAEMEAALCFSSEDEALHRALAALADGLVSGTGERGNQLRIANALWGQTGYPIRDEYRWLVAERYGAGLSSADFAGAAEDARREINAWIAAKTNGRIEELLLPGDLRPSTLLVLVNAIHFRGAWASRFDEEMTRDRLFTLPADEEEGIERRRIEVPMMYQQARLPYWRGKGLTILELPYEGDAYSMVILRPKEPEGLPRLEEALTAEFLRERLAELEPAEVGVLLPRFRVDTRFRLKETLQALGMREAFTPAADFSGLSERGGLFVDDVIVQAEVTVDEAGTEATGATAVMMKKRGNVFRADHPFLFLIRDRRSGAIVFLGRVVDPRTPKEE